MDTTKIILIFAILICGVTGYYTYKMSEDVKQLQEQVLIDGQKIDSLMSAMEQRAVRAAAAIPDGERPDVLTEDDFTTEMQVTATYRLEDRYVRFEVELPKVISKQEGQVVVNITVDEIGAVKKTSIGKGTTIKDEEVLEAARKAALRTGFNISIGAGLLAGTITYKYEEVEVVDL